MSLDSALTDVLSSIVASSDEQARQAYASVANQPTIIEAVAFGVAGNFDGFARALLYPFEAVVEGLLEEVAPNQPEAQFLLRHSSFVEAQLCTCFSQFEGLSCSVDKANFVMDSLFRFFKTGREIVINRSQPFTYHLPTKLLDSHAAMVEFFTAVRRLYYGRPAEYLAMMNSFADKFAVNGGEVPVPPNPDLASD